MSTINESDVGQYWDANSEVWTEQVRKGNDLYRELFNNPSMFELLGSVANRRVLDAGCGEGRNTRRLASLGALVVGVDISPAMIAAARDAEAGSPQGIAYHLGSFSHMPFLADGSFDAAVAFMSLMDAPDYHGALLELHRVLVSEGLLCYNITHPCFVTEGMSWINNEEGAAHRLAVGNYFKKEPYVDKWRFSASTGASNLREFQVPYFPRTLSEYLNGLLAVGFRIVEIREPRPTEEDCRRYPALERWRKHAAIFLQVKARKAS